MASGQLGPQMIPLLGVSGLAVVPPGKLASHHDCRRWFCRRRRHRRQFCQTLSVNADPLDLFDQPLLLDMIFLGTPQLRGGVNISFFYKVSFEKHPNGHEKRKEICPALAKCNLYQVENGKGVFCLKNHCALVWSLLRAAVPIGWDFMFLPLRAVPIGWDFFILFLMAVPFGWYLSD